MLRGAAVHARFRLAVAAACAVAIPALSLAQDPAHDSGHDSGQTSGQNSAMPVRRPGWWELNLTVEGPTPQPIHGTARICTDAEVDKVRTPVGINTGQTCPAVQISRTPDGWTFEHTCAVGKITMSTEGRASGDFSSSYHVDLTTRINPPPVPQAAEVRTAIDAKWLGACPADKKPGDVETTVETNAAPPAK
jgi:hypothetical protein